MIVFGKMSSAECLYETETWMYKEKLQQKKSYTREKRKKFS